MIYLYLFALVLGGVLLGASMLLGGGQGEAGAHVDADADAGNGDMAHADGHDAPGGFESFLVAFLSMRFWTFFLAFFGLTGVVLDGFGLVPSTILAALLSVGMGLCTGLGAVWLMRRVRADDSNSAVTSADYIGKTGRVMVAFGPGQTGKVRMDVRGSTIDLLAIPIDETTFTLKEEVIVIEMEGTRAKVARLTPDRLSKP
ncbi:MAG: YqiJ family protein [Myxococcota bacterium]|nr:YqiJ family protein [Myxococcota bacterium]